MYENNEPLNIKFDKERKFYPGTPKIIRWVINHSGGYIEDENKAGYIVAGATALLVILSFVLFFVVSYKQKPSTPEEMRQMIQVEQTTVNQAK